MAEFVAWTCIWPASEKPVTNSSDGTCLMRYWWSAYKELWRQVHPMCH